MRKMNGIGKLATAALLVTGVSTLAGCDALGVLGPNLSIQYVMPLGFGGSPGLYNPYGVVQALVNAALGSALPSSSSSSSSSASAQSNPSANIGAIAPVINNP